MLNKRIITILVLFTCFTVSNAIQWQASKSLNMAIPPEQLDISFEKHPAKPLQNNTPMDIGHITPAFVAGVGGVSFDQTASPHDSLLNAEWDVSYNPQKPDGQRLEIIMNNKLVQTRIYDWMLVPLAAYAQSEYYSCFTLFGTLQDTDKEEEIINKGGKIMNYHPAFENTLLGLRLMHLDMLILYPTSVVLPTNDDGSELLGNGESPPDVSKNVDAFIEFSNFFEHSHNSLGYRHRSWVISDFQQEITIGIQNDSLVLTGTPGFYFWRFKSDRADYDQTAVHNQIVENIQGKMQQANEPKSVIIDMLLDALKKYEHNYTATFYGGSIEEILAKPSDPARREILQLYQTEDLANNLLIPMLVYMDSQQVEPLFMLSDAVSKNEELLRAINPPVWNAAEQTMRFAAFFRYFKKNQSIEWNNFLKQIEDISTTPVVETPTVIYPPQ